MTKLTGGRLLTIIHLVLPGTSAIFSHLSESADFCSMIYLLMVPSSSSGAVQTRVRESLSIFSALRCSGADGFPVRKEIYG